MIDTRVIQIFVASPGDVEEERQSVRTIIHDWNETHTTLRRLMLLPVMWELQAAPELGARPQGIINRKLLDSCDILVGVFWTRIGTPTGKASSGTVEELRRFRRRNGRIMLYFSDTPIPPAQTDPTQYEKLIEFRKQCQLEGIVRCYASRQEFVQLFHRDIDRVVDEIEVQLRLSDAVVRMGQWTLR
jgi:hypothetical protein